MKLIWHIIKKDIVRDRGALVLWALLFLGQVAIGFFARNWTAIDKDWVMRLQLGSAALVFLQVTMGYILVARLVQADGLIGTSVFWLTRPISARRLLAAKALGALLLFGLLPVLLLLPWWLACGLGGRDLFWSAVEMFGWQLLMIAPAFLVGTLTDDLGRVLLWTLLLVIGLLSWIALLQASFRSGLSPFGSHPASVFYTRLWVVAWVFMIGGVVIGAHQYLTRHFYRSVGLVTAGLGLLAMIGQWWPWDWTRSLSGLHKPALLPVTDAWVNQVRFEFQPANGAYYQNQTGDKTRDAGLTTRLRVRGLPDDLTLASNSAVQTWSWGGAVSLTRTGDLLSNYYPGQTVMRRAYSLPEPKEDPETLQWWRAWNDRKNVERFAHGLKPLDWRGGYGVGRDIRDENGIQLWGYTTVPNSFLAKMQSEPAAYRLAAWFTIYRPVIAGELPLKPGAKAAGWSRSYELHTMKAAHLPRYLSDGAEGQRVGANVMVVSTEPAVDRYGLWLAAATVEDYRRWNVQGGIMTMNRVMGDTDTVWDEFGGQVRLQVGGVILGWTGLQFSPRHVIRNGRWAVLDPQWQEHSSLVMLTVQEAGRYQREISTEKYEVEAEKPKK